MRKLASVQLVENISPIDGADSIEKIQVLGWELVSKKGEFRPGELCVYFECDSILPDLPIFEFVKRGSDRSSALRLRTIKLRGVVSQGLAMPVSILDEFGESGHKWEIGDDVSELIGVKKWEPPPPSGNISNVPKSNFPHYVPKTDETRIQSVPRLLDELSGVEVYVAVKMDGCSATYIHHQGEYHVCSRNLSLKSMSEKQELYQRLLSEGKNPPVPVIDHWWEISDKLGLKEKLEKEGNFSVQGEICGPAIQKNRLKLTENNFFAFNVYSIDDKRYLDLDEMLDFCNRLNIPTVPIETKMTLNHSVKDLLEMAQGKYPGGHEREGIVVRPTKEMYSEILKGRASFKVISNKFLLKIKE